MKQFSLFFFIYGKFHKTENIKKRAYFFSQKEDYVIINKLQKILLIKKEKTCIEKIRRQNMQYEN